MSRSIDCSALPAQQHGDQIRIVWKQSAGCKVPFVYDNISGEFEIITYHKGKYITIQYENQIKKLRTGRLLQLQITDLIDPDKVCLPPRNLKSHETFLREVKELYGDEYTVLSTYVHSKAAVRMRHNSKACNYHEFSPTPNNFLRAAGCPACSGNPSFPEMCILLVLCKFFPDARKQRIQGRECDIAFTSNGKLIGIQYDGAFFHQKSTDDDTFNHMFLSEHENHLLRIREEGCPPLESHERLYEISSPSNYSLENLQNTLSNLFRRLNILLETNYEPQLTEKLMHRARRHSKKSFRYSLLLEEYIAYLHTHKDTPHNKTQNNLQNRLTTALREQRFGEEEVKRINAVRRQYGLCMEERPPKLIYQDMLKFYERHKMLPRQQAGPIEEYNLYKEIKRCLKKKSFDGPQLEKYRHLCKGASNYPSQSEDLFNAYLLFVQVNKRLPSFNTAAKEERSLANKVQHRLSRGTFSTHQKAEIQKIKRKYSRLYMQKRIIDEYCTFLSENDRLPFYRAEGDEGKLESNMLRYLRGRRFTQDECEKILAFRAPYQTLTRQLREHVQYLGGDAHSFVIRQYEAFCRVHERLPAKSMHNREEHELCGLVQQYIDPALYPLGPQSEAKPNPPKKTFVNKAPTETFEEAMAFYAENGRFPLHVHRGSLPQRPYEGKLAARVTMLYRTGRFSLQQLEALDQLRLKNPDKPQLLYEAFFDYIETHGGQSPKHCPHTDENRLLNSLKNHMRQGRYTQQQLDSLLEHLPGRRKNYPALDA